MTLINARWVARMGPLHMLRIGAVVAGMAGCGVGVLGLTGLGGLMGIVVCVILYVSVTGLLGANCVASLLALYPTQAGAAAGLAVAGQFAMGAGFSALVSAMADGSPLPMCITIAAAGIGSLACYFWIRLHVGVTKGIETV